MVEIVGLIVQIFMVKNVKNIIFFICLVGVLFSDTIMPKSKEVYHLDLNIYDGLGSLLLDWSAVDETTFKEFNIFRRDELEIEFNLIANLSADSIKKNRYLDVNCDNNTRYFYFIEGKDVNNKIYKSDYLKPSFGSIKKQNLRKIQLEDSAWDLFGSIFRAKVVEHENNFNLRSVDALIKLLSAKSIDIDLWVEKFPIHLIEEVSPIFEPEKKNYFEDDILIEFQKKEQLYRNHFLLTPKEWAIKTRNIFTTAKNNWFVLRDSFQDYVKVVKGLSPIIILGSDSKTVGTVIELLIVNSSELDQYDVKLSFFDEQIAINISEILPNYVFQKNIPADWTFAELKINDEEVDRIEFIVGKKISKTLDNELIPSENISNLKMSNESSETWINEIYWESNSNRLSLEVAGAYTGANKFVISINGEDLWRPIDFVSSFDSQYIDSTFNIDFIDDDQIFLEYSIIENDRTRTLELFKLYNNADLNNHRFPDGKRWSKTGQNSFGSKNIDKKSAMGSDLIPELFVLYQNYPNPFNSNTRISFDLLQDAILSLYVTDATGRIKTIFSDKEFYNSGKYDFDWNAESFSTGVYFFTINAEVEGYFPIIFSRKMIYLK